jgi:hypothetical protein
MPIRNAQPPPSPLTPSSPSQSHVLLPKFVPHMIECMSAEDPQLRQPATYAVGVLAQYAPEALKPVLKQCLGLISKVVTAKDARESDNALATDNAVSSLVKVAKFCGEGLDTESLMKGVLSYLPLRYDDTESKLVHSWMVTGLGRGEPLWIGANGSRVPDLLAALARGLEQHRLNVDGLDDDEEESDDLIDTADPLFDNATLEALPRIAAAVKKSPVAAAVAGYVRTLPKNLKKELLKRGFSE